MAIAQRYPGSDFASLLDGSGNRIYIRLSGAVAIQAVTAQTTKVFQGTNSIVLPAAIEEVMDILDPTPVASPPPVDITNGKLRIHPGGGAIARQLTVGDPKGDWQVFFLNGDGRMIFTTNAINPDIQTWPFLRV